MSEQETAGRFDFPEEADTDVLDQQSHIETGQAEGEARPEPHAPGVPLFSGTELTVEEARRLMAGSVCRLIVVAGMPDSGKTTLLATLYELFLRGPFAGYHFAGSRTQLAFDERCHKSRTASRREDADTERTVPKEIGYLHLALRDEAAEQPILHLLFTDISGETFRDEVRKSSSGTMALRPLRRADHFVLLIDAEQLADPARRQKAVLDAKMILRSCTETRMIGHRTHVEVAYSRWDAVPEAETLPGGGLRAFLDAQEPQLRASEPHVASLRIEPLAARPARGLSLGLGLDALLQIWAGESALVSSAQPHKATAEEDDREMTRFTWRQAEQATTEGAT